MWEKFSVEFPRQSMILFWYWDNQMLEIRTQIINIFANVLRWISRRIAILTLILPSGSNSFTKKHKTTPSLGQRKAVRDFLYTVFLTENLLIRSMNCEFWRIGLKRCTKNAEKVDKRGKYRYYICADNGKAGVCQHSIFWWIRSVKKQPERIFIYLQAHNRAYLVSHCRRLPIDTDWPRCSTD